MKKELSAEEVLKTVKNTNKGEMIIEGIALIKGKDFLEKWNEHSDEEKKEFAEAMLILSEKYFAYFLATRETKENK